MKIIGGIYREICQEPVRDDLYGSGLRAAFAISHAAPSLEVVTITNSQEQEEIQAFAKEFGFSIATEQRATQVQFTYPTPLSAPVLLPRDLMRFKLTASDETVLAFGMIEGDWSVEGTNIIIDPQGIASLSSRIEWSGKRTALVCNRSEIMKLANGRSTVEQAAREVLKQHRFDTVIVKCGALGAIVIEEKEVCNIGVFPVEPIYPIGSGDVFSSVFAYCWGELGLPTVESARCASRATAVWVSRGPLQVLEQTGRVVNPELLEERSLIRIPRIYLAGPFFSVAQRWLVDTFREGLSGLGAQVVSPIHDIGLGPPSKVAPADLELLTAADGVLVILDSLDPGTLFEVGYAKACKIPVVGFASHSDDSNLTMIIGTGIPVYQDLSTAAYHAIWAGSIT